MQRIEAKILETCQETASVAKNIRNRIAFCKHYQHWTVEQWKKVLFSDETLIKQFQTAKSFVRRPSGCRYESKYTVSTVKNSPSVMVWGAISGQGRGGLWIMPKNSTITGQVYLSILQEKLPLFMHILDCDYFQQDGAPVHTCKLVTKWLAESRIELIKDWPGNSPDLNVIENCWVLLKSKVALKYPKNETELKAAIVDVWTREISVEYCQKLVESMPKRIQAVLANKGHSIKY